MTALEDYEEWYFDTDGWTRTEGMRKADAAIESLKCCGNCKWTTLFGGCIEPQFNEETGMMGAQVQRVQWEPCRFTPSRWKERT